ncbi:MAG: serine/threonine-protein kinase [Lentisphaeria bacterium]|nr:serine/threonine-protein kinase [Lentisphaeria bacterium]
MEHTTPPFEVSDVTDEEMSTSLVTPLAGRSSEPDPSPFKPTPPSRDKVIKISSGGTAEEIAELSAHSPHIYTPAVGDMINDRYRLRKLVGEGGVCRVFKAFDQLLKMTVAIKVLRPDCVEDPDFIQTLLDEARMAMQLSHSQIVRLHTLQGSSSFYYLVMEYVEGRTLRECLGDYDALPVSTVAQLLQAAHPPLRHAHKRGILHNDIKPDNLLLTHSGTIKFLDFGLACLANQSSRESALLGTPAYMSPERLRQDVLDLRSDIYSLGLTVYELLTGHLPFPANLHARDYLKMTAIEMPGIDEKLRPVLEKAVAIPRADRWETLDDFIDAFITEASRISTD